MKNGSIRLSRLEQSIRCAVPSYDWKSSRVYAEMAEDHRQRLIGYIDRFQAEGLSQFTVSQLDEFELLIFPFAKEEEADGE